MSLGDAVQATPEALELPVFVGSKLSGFLSLRRRLEHKVWGASPRDVWFSNSSPWSGRKTCELKACPPAIAGSDLDAQVSWGLRPRLYAYACFAGKEGI